VMYDEAQDALAAEYVLGTLSSDEREHAEALRDIDPGFAESVRLWERRLGELNVMVEAVEPPPAVWEKISAEIGDVAPPDTTSSTLAAIGALGEGRPFITEEAPLTVAEKPAGESASVMPTAPQLSDVLSNSITTSLAKTLDEPPADLSQTETGYSLYDESDGNVVQLTRRVKKWRSVAIAMQAIAALLAVYVIAAQFYPNLMPLRGRAGEQQTAQGSGAQPASRLVAVLQQDPTSPAFLLTVDPQNRTLVVRRVSATPEQGRSYELWLIAKGAPTPKSLGVVGQDEFTQRAIPGNFDVATLRSASYAISLEPSGGSQSGVPTGPILFTGNIVESVPATPRT
jgi:anti-sigma-K factor RskA